MSKSRYDEGKVLRQLDRKSVRIDYALKVIEVAKEANKIEIKKAIEEVFGVKVEKVTTMRVLGKVKRMGATFGKRADWKKATVTLTADSKTIEFFDGMA